ncbi:hypothetical protein K469DRAFT_719818 [Zopfia rhizophila CBS 207.26]|uniref:Uncharacterized protein n=1 Tax=Zopfia rhizophila CBS 207.26 TaxID=1314779 RepID=A0A6A6DDF6_9PEZI|nr:hypothetical protein K469DRAFT_719818 [Zopfia rhizophila CBS 207.26]
MRHGWNFNVLPTTIQNCGKKSTITKDDTVMVGPKVEDLALLFSKLLKSAMLRMYEIVKTLLTLKARMLRLRKGKKI